MHKPKRVVVLAGHRRSLASIVLLDALHGLRSEDVEIVSVLSVFELNWQRIMLWRRRFGRYLLRRITSELGIRRAGAFTVERGIFLERLKSRGVACRSLGQACRARGWDYHVVPDINGERSRALVAELAPDCAVYSGAGILREPLLELFPGGVLNAHCGPIPHVRGMNGVEWSLYLGLMPEATLHLVDAGIDTGPILGRRTVAPESGDTLEALRGKAVLAGIDLISEGLPRVDTCPRDVNPPDHGCQFHAMAPALKEVVETWLATGVTPIGPASSLDPDDLRSALQKRADGR